MNEDPHALIRALVYICIGWVALLSVFMVVYTLARLIR